MADPNIGQLVATTLRNRRSELEDNMSDNVPFYNRLRRKNRMSLDGGRTIVIPLDYAENASFQFYSGYETLNVNVNDFIDAAEFDWKQASIAVSISGLEQLRNSGRSAAIKLLASKIKNAQRTYTNQMGAQVHADGTGTAGKEIGGLGLLVPSTNTNTVGGISGNTYTWWRDYVIDASTYNGTATVYTNIQDWMMNLYINLTRNGDKPDLGLFSNVYYQMYWRSLTGIQRINGTSEGNSGFDSIKFVGMDCVLEGGVGGNMNDSNSVTTATAFFLNTDFLNFTTHSDRDIEVVGGERQNVNQDATVQLMLWAGNMTVSNRMLQGKAKE